MRKVFLPLFHICILFLFLFGTPDLCSQTVKTPPFRHGINLTLWFEANSPGQIQFTRFTRKDFENIKSLGVDVIRLPINLHYMTSGAPDYILDPMFLDFLDQAINWAEDLGIYIILDNHTFNSSVPTDSHVDQVLLKVWPQMAAHFKNRSDYVLYEVLNEPHGLDSALWGKMQGKVVSAIRAVDSSHTIIVGPANYNSYKDLASLPKYEDTNLLYTFHFYDPMIFTHQGAAWTTPSLASLVGIPFPYGAGQIPAVPSSLKGTWVESTLEDYGNIGSVEKIKNLIDIAARFAKDRKVAVFCGELGVYMKNVNPEDRVRWYKMVRSSLEEKNISWASWDYYGGFGLFNSPEGGDFNSELNVPLVEALGFVAPPQKKNAMNPDTGEIELFDDYAGAKILTESFSKEGKISFYATGNTASGKYAISWTNVERYSSIRFNFMKERDFSVLVREHYVLDMMVYTKDAGACFEVRFRNPENSADEKPWRMSYKIDESLLHADGVWHRIRIPLTDMKETGAWKEGWFTPEGKFSWHRIATFEIAAEQQTMKGKTILFDDIKITK